MASAFLSILSLSEILFMLRGAIHLKAIDPQIHIFSLALNLQFQTHMSKCLLNILAWGFTVTSNWLYPQPKFTSSLYNSSLFRISYFCQWRQLCQSHTRSKTTVISDTSFYLITKLCQFFLQSGSHLIALLFLPPYWPKPHLQTITKASLPLCFFAPIQCPGFPLTSLKSSTFCPWLQMTFWGFLLFFPQQVFCITPFSHSVPFHPLGS